ncbi:RNA polymerase sigma-70 factor, ECF subfamily [Variovorax sp. PDC80]|uniref:RNA polymerase sigma factor n=1 Tax=Variovorax sp. PDC80 TaxID=1882827 RepID=UPI0008F09965|nr:RNA polymerase sigma factor [Variovorax sp. PDC80]SFP34327.1 RNA polymerase sigma-70 factor, ECF subfamily [Variovorax sp. PDC80]
MSHKHSIDSPLIAALVSHYEELVDHVRRLSFGRGERGAAREIVHEVCADLIETPPRTPIHTPLAFLRILSKRRAVDRWRAERSRDVLIELMAEPPEALDLHEPARIVAAREGIEVLAEAIAVLPQRCREVFVMHKVHELPQAEVAAHLGISVKAVEKHLRRGMEACARALVDFHG